MILIQALGEHSVRRDILVAVDDSANSRHALHYVAGVAAMVAELHITLANVQTPVSRFLKDDARKDIRLRSELDRAIRRNTEMSKAVTENGKAALIKAGIAEQRITTITLRRQLGVGKDILEYALDSLFDAVVVGRRGLSGLVELFLGSTSNNIVQNAAVTPVWVIGDKVTPTKVLVPVDGSEYSLRVVDHLAFMLCDWPGLKLHFFHVKPKLVDFCEIDFSDSETAQLLNQQVKAHGCIDDFYPRACDKLESFGISKNRISIETADAMVRCGPAVVEAAAAGGFDTVVLGKKGGNGRFFTGSVTHYVLNKISNRALWIIP
jgi:nucleotide-binding universal stress UspA family protein